jgi:hypothetical protein
MKKIVALVAFLALAGCATKEKLIGSDAAPAAQGTITAKKDGNNTKIKLEAEHLAPAEKIVPGAKNYVLWIKPAEQKEFINAGALNVDNDLKVKYETTVPYKQFRVMLTPESADIAKRPTGPIIFDQEIARRM